MLKRLILLLAAAAALACAAPAAADAMAQPVAHVDPARMMGRWYEVARLPNMTQKGCQAGTSDWTRAAEGFAVVQACHRGTPDGPLAEWKAHARVADPVSNAKFKMSFFGGLVSQEYWVLDQRPDQVERAALGVEVGDAARGSAQLRRQAGESDMELTYCVHRWRYDIEAA